MELAGLASGFGWWGGHSWPGAPSNTAIPALTVFQLLYNPPPRKNRREWLDATHGEAGAAVLAEAAAEEAAAAAALGVRRVGTIDDLRCLDEDLAPDAVPARLRRGVTGGRDADTDSPTSVTLSQRRSGSAQRGTPITPDVRLYHRAVVVAQEATGEKRRSVCGRIRLDTLSFCERGCRAVVRSLAPAPFFPYARRSHPSASSFPALLALYAPSLLLRTLPASCAPTHPSDIGSLRGMVRQLSIDQFENESRRVSLGPESVSKPAVGSPMFERVGVEPTVAKVRTQERRNVRVFTQC